MRIAFLLACLGLSATVRGDIFVLDPTQSILTLSGTATSFNWTVQPQATNSLSSSYSGTIDATLGAGSITFNNSAAAATASGNYQPAVGGGPGSAPADDGAIWAGGPWTGYVGLRDLIGSLSSSPITLSGGSFNASSILFSFLTGTVDRYILVFMGTPVSGSQSLPGVSSMNGSGGTGSLSTSRGTETLTVPIDISFNVSMLNNNDSTFRLRGNLVATSVVPEPSSYMLIAMGLLVLAAHVQRSSGQPSSSGVS